MAIVRSLLDRMFLVGAVVAGGLVPGFITQYRQRLGGRLDQARIDLEPWQQIANQFHHGDINQLIHYHLQSSDPTFHAEGTAIQNLVASVQHLQGAADALHTSLFHQVGYLAMHTDSELGLATWRDWVPTFSLSAEGLTFALLFALAIWLLFHALWWMLALLSARRQSLPT
jgi:Protein of unknown function (DUF2937)